MKKPARFHIATLGCKVNQYESQAIREAWISKGCEETADPTQADCILINSCAVTAEAVRDLRRATRKMHRENNQAAIVIAGCAGEIHAQELQELPGVAQVVPQSRKDELRSWFGPAFSESTPEAIAGYPRARAVVKVQDGCSHGCTFCIVPLTRGPSRSREPQAILEEIHRLFTAGFCEASLSGVNLRHYGRELAPAMDFWDLLSYLENGLKEWRGKARLRLSSLDPGQIAPGQLYPKALETLAQSRLVCPHLHLSLQSGSPEILRRMGRGHYQPQQILEFLEQLATIWPVHGLGADLLMGFPGESDAHFQETLSFCEVLPLTYAHVFPYSPRPGTAAAEFPNQTSDAEKKERAARLRGLAQEKKQSFLHRLARLESVNVVVQGTAPPLGMPLGAPLGLNEYYAECRFTAPYPELEAKTMVRATPVAVGQGYLTVTTAPSTDVLKDDLP